MFAVVALDLRWQVGLAGKGSPLLGDLQTALAYWLIAYAGCFWIPLAYCQVIALASYVGRWWRRTGTH